MQVSSAGCKVGVEGLQHIKPNTEPLINDVKADEKNQNSYAFIQLVRSNQRSRRSAHHRSRAWRSLDDLKVMKAGAKPLSWQSLPERRSSLEPNSTPSLYQMISSGIDLALGGGGLRLISLKCLFDDLGGHIQSARLCNHFLEIFSPLAIARILQDFLDQTPQAVRC